MSTRIFGSGIKRREDPRLITGGAKYTDDMALPGMLHMAMLRSPYAHAHIKHIDTATAQGMEGVVAVYTATDLSLGAVPCAWLVPNSDLKTPAHPPLAADKVRYVGDAVAIVIAEDRYLAQDAADTIHVEYEVLGAVVNPEEATQEGAPQLFDDVPNNIAFRWIASSGDEGLEKAFAEADVVVKDRIVQQRLLPTAMEPRAALAQWNSGTGEMTIWCTSQNPHIHRFILSGMLGLAEHTLDGTIDWERIHRWSDDEVVAHLTVVRGIGPWTAQMFLMFCLGRADVFPLGDLGIQNALRNLYRLRKPHEPRHALKVAAAWRVR
ncbi:MAG: molybdopterin-dependent oxidoreductase [Blastochloris sp.]|nr:molybdopterin-dependent oxidoreductase [Blastochloris sp.]